MPHYPIISTTINMPFSVAPFFVSAFFFLSASVPHLSSFFYFCFSATFFVSFQLLSFLFSSRVPFFFSPKTLFFSPKRFCFNPRYFFSSAQKNIVFNPKRFCFSPRYFFSLAQKSLPVCGSVPPSFCFFSSYLSFLPLATTYCPFSAQVFNSKPFSAASCLFI